MSHHQSFRKRGARGTEPIPATRALLRILDRTVLIVGIIGPLMTVPQILKIFILQDATGVSVIFWGMCALLDIPWILYGLIHHERPILVTYTMWLVMNVIVFFGAIYFGAGVL